MDGRNRVEWAGRFMPVVQAIRKGFRKDQPLLGMRITVCAHVTAETANLVLALRDGGAEISLCASNPLSTQDDIANYLDIESQINVFAKRGVTEKEYYANIALALAQNPTLTIDDGADLAAAIAKDRPDLIDGIIGGTEETTSGLVRLRSMEMVGDLPFPIIAVNDAQTKRMFDNRYGTGQSTLDGIIRATNLLIAGTRVVICGYGWCGRGVALRARGLGAEVIITETNPIKALEAVMDGFRVMPMAEAAKVGNLFITVTGNKHVLGREHFEVMPDGAILANAGHFNVEIDVGMLEQMAKRKHEVRSLVNEYELKNKKRLYLLSEGRLVNLACAEGHPPTVMDLSFANQALAIEYLAKHGRMLEKKVYPIPEEIDSEVARLKLKHMGVAIDKLAPEQTAYLQTWQEGT